MREANDPYLKIASLANRHLVAEIFRRASVEELTPILIKGFAVGRFFPPTQPRIQTDVDLVVAENEYRRARFWLSKEKFHAYPIDLHEGFGDRDPSAWNVLFDRSQILDVDGVGVRVLADEDNLRLTAAHWLIDGGVYEEKLKDIYYLVKNRKPDFDWDLCLSAAGAVRRTWVLTAVATARDYLELNVTDLSKEIRDFQLPKWYKPAIEREWRLGPYLRIPAKNALRRPKLLFEQIRRRFPPNPIAATCDTESPFDDVPRWPLQLKSLRKRISNKL